MSKNTNQKTDWPSQLGKYFKIGSFGNNMDSQSFSNLSSIAQIIGWFL